MSTNHMEIIEECYLDVLSDAWIGKRKVGSTGELRMEVSKWLHEKYGDEGLEKLKLAFQNNGGIGVRALSYTEILENRIKYAEDQFIPKTLALRQFLMESLSVDNQKVLKKLKSQYLHEHKRQIEEKERRIPEKEGSAEYLEKIKEYKLLEKLGEVCPRIETLRRFNESLYFEFLEIKSIVENIPDHFREAHQNLCKERHKISLGSIGNVLSMVTSLEPNEHQETLDIIELLLIDE